MEKENNVIFIWESTNDSGACNTKELNKNVSNYVDNMNKCFGSDLIVLVPMIYETKIE